jgi:DNA polymerase III subunit beta
MEITFLKEHLLDKLHLLNRIASYNSTLPILTSVYLEAKKGSFILKATNLEMGIIINIRASIKKTGNIAIPAKIFTNVIEGITEKKITLKKSGNNLKIKTISSNNEIKGINGKDFPLIPQIKKNSFLKIKGYQLSKAIEQVIPSIAISNMRPDLAGIYILKEKNSVKIVATDGFRLSEKTIKQKNPNIKKEKNINSVIIPNKTATEIIHTFNQEEKTIYLFMDENQIAIQGDNIYLVSRIVDGDYPDYSQIIPKDHKIEVILEKKEFLDAIKLASLFSHEDFNDVLLDIIPSKKEMNISAQSKNRGKMLKKIKIKVSGKKASVSLNYRYLFDCLNSVKSDKIRILINQENSPILIEPFDKKERDFLGIVSPIDRVNNEK